MSIDEAMRRIRATGRNGFSLWIVGYEYMACLLGKGTDCDPDYSTNLWNYTKTAREAMEKIVSKAAELAAGGE